MTVGVKGRNNGVRREQGQATFFQRMACTSMLRVHTGSAPPKGFENANGTKTLSAV